MVLCEPFCSGEAAVEGQRIVSRLACSSGHGSTERRRWARSTATRRPGGSFLDTANNYANWVEGGRGGESEELLGRWMRRRGNRERLFLATKVGGAPGSKDLSHAGDPARPVEGSLRRLQTDSIDLDDAHVDHRSVALEETLEAFGELGHSRGRCGTSAAATTRRGGSSARGASVTLGGLPRYCCIQQRHTYLRPRRGAGFGVQLVADDGLLDFCAANPEVALLAYSPLLSGSYTVPGRALPEQYLGADTDSRLNAIRRVADETGANANQLVLAWLMATTPSAIPVISASTEAQLEQNLAALAVDLSAEVLTMLDATTGMSGRRSSSVPAPYARQKLRRSVAILRAASLIPPGWRRLIAGRFGQRRLARH